MKNLLFGSKLFLFREDLFSGGDLCAGKIIGKKGTGKVQGVPQSQTAALPRPQEEEETDKSKQAQIEQTLPRF